MQLDGMVKRLKDAGRNIFISMNNAASVKKKQKPEPREVEDLRAKEGRGKQGMKEDIDPALLEALGLKHKLKAAGKKILSTLGHGSDEDLRKDLQKKVGVPQFTLIVDDQFNGDGSIYA